MAAEIEGASMAGGEPSPRGRIAAMFARGDALLLAFAVTFASLFFTNKSGLPPRLFLLLIVPAAFFSWLKFSPMNRGDRSVGISGRIYFVRSIVLFAVAIYLLAVCITSGFQLDVLRKNVDTQWMYAAFILMFTLIVALSVAFLDTFLFRMIFVLSFIIAGSALVNVASFVFQLENLRDLPTSRLINWLGMPGYFNSTNVSVTYALFFAGAIAILADPRFSRRARFWLIPASLMLLVAVAFTQSRGTYFGVFVGVVVVLWTKFTVSRRQLAIGLGAIIASGFLFFSWLPSAQNVLTSRGASYRPEIWSIYAEKAVRRPLVGYGALSDIGIKLSNGVEIDQPHNLIMSAQIRGGIFGALAMVAIIVGCLYWALRYFRATGTVVPLAMMTTLVTAGMFDYNLVVSPLNWPWVTFWLPFGICAGAEIVVRRCSQPPA